LPKKLRCDEGQMPRFAFKPILATVFFAIGASLVAYAYTPVTGGEAAIAKRMMAGFGGFGLIGCALLLLVLWLWTKYRE
jgi:hypothetical protein